MDVNVAPLLNTAAPHSAAAPLAASLPVPVPVPPLPVAVPLKLPLKVAPPCPVLSLQQLVASQIRIREQKFDVLLKMARTEANGWHWQAQAAVFDAELARLDHEIQAEYARLHERQVRLAQQAAENARVKALAAETIARDRKNWGMWRQGFNSLQNCSHNYFILHRHLRAFTSCLNSLDRLAPNFAARGCSLIQSRIRNEKPTGAR